MRSFGALSLFTAVFAASLQAQEPVRYSISFENRAHHEQWHARSVWERCTATVTNTIIADGLTVHCKLPAHHEGKHYATRAQPPYPDAEYLWQRADERGDVAGPGSH